MVKVREVPVEMTSCKVKLLLGVMGTYLLSLASRVDDAAQALAVTTQPRELMESELCFINSHFLCRRNN